MNVAGSCIVSAAILGAAGLYFFGLSKQYDSAVDQHQSRYVAMANLQTALSDIVSVRRAMVAYYNEHGDFPADNQSLRLGAATSFARHAIRRIDIRPGGRIVTSFDARLGQDASLLYALKPSRVGVGGAVNWDCQIAGLDPSLHTLVPKCRVVDKIQTNFPAGEPMSPVARFKLAMEKRRHGQIHQLVQEGFDLNRPIAGELPLMFAVKRNDSGLVTLLLRLRANPNAVHRDGTTALMRSVTQLPFSNRAVGALVKGGAKLELRDRTGRTALMYAASVNNYRAVDLLLKAGADIEAKDYGGTTVVKFATVRGRDSQSHRRIQQVLRKNNEFIVRIPPRPGQM
ncbi:MAG: ankyrin repeat domain-containing protein [Pseudomonadota bacterium]